MTGWTAERVLAKDALSAEHVDAVGFAPLVVIGFLGPYPRGDEFCPVFLFELGETVWSGNGQADDIGHVAIVSEEVFGAGGGDLTAGDGCLEGGDAGPLLDGIDQVRCGGIGESVGHLVEDVFALDKSDNRGRFSGPEAFEAAEVGVLAAGEKAMKTLGEDGEIAIRVVDAGVVVIGHRDGERDLDLGALGGHGEAVDECVVGVVVGAEEESPLGAAAGNHVVTTGHDLAREGHA